MYASTKVYSPNGKYVGISISGFWSDVTTVQTLTKCIYITGTSVNVQTANCAYGNMTNEGSYAGLENSVYITRIVGYK